MLALSLFHYGEPSSCGGERLFDLGSAVRSGDEPGLVSRWREIHAAFQHFVKEAIEALLVGLHDLGETRRWRCAEVDAEHAADRLRGECNAGSPCLRLQSF